MMNLISIPDKNFVLVPDLCENLKDLIDKFQNICRLFRRSPTKNPKPQKFVIQTFGGI